MKTWWVLFCLCAAAGIHGADAVPLPADAAHWTAELFWEGSTRATRAQAGTFEIVTDPQHGPCLAIGPWRAGQYSMRYQWREKLPHTRVTLKGFYRTEKLQPYEAEAGVLYFAGDKKLTRASIPLAPADEWTAFEAVFFRPDEAADGVRPGVGLAQHTEGRVLFRGLSVSAAAAPPEFPEFTPKIKRAKASKFDAGEFYRLQENEGTWWLVPPDGQALYASGTVGPGLKNDEAPQAAVDFVRAHGFKCLGGWTSIWAWANYNDAQQQAGQPPLPVFLCHRKQLAGWKVRLSGRCRRRARRQRGPSLSRSVRSAVRKGVSRACG